MRDVCFGLSLWQTFTYNFQVSLYQSLKHLNDHWLKTMINESLGYTEVGNYRLPMHLIIKQWAVYDHLLEIYCSADFDHFDFLDADGSKLCIVPQECSIMKSNQTQLSEASSFLIKVI